MEELRWKRPDLLVGMEDLLAEFYRDQRMYQLGNKILSFLKQLQERRDKQSIDASEAIQQKMLDYVNAHLCDYELTITSIAAYLNLSVSYTSKLFKSVNGIGFLTYIHNRRIEMAKQMLVETDDNLKEIAARIGYNNDIAMIRLFKKNAGITPGKYREIRRAEAKGR
jgi:YesN/AraC family two-component response regulator